VARAGLSGWFPVTPLPQALWRLGDLLSIARNIEEGLYVARGYAHASHVRNQRQGRVAPSSLPRRPKEGVVGDVEGRGVAGRPCRPKEGGEQSVGSEANKLACQTVPKALREECRSHEDRRKGGVDTERRSLATTPVGLLWDSLVEPIW
jgi:hypothetical protein